MNTHIGKRPFWFRRHREALRVIELAQAPKFPTHRKNTR